MLFQIRLRNRRPSHLYDSLTHEFSTLTFSYL